MSRVIVVKHGSKRSVILAGLRGPAGKDGSGGGGSAGVSSFNARTGAVTLGSDDVVEALGFDPIAESDLPTLADVATSGSYNDLTDKPAAAPALEAGDGIDIDDSNPAKLVISATSGGPGAVGSVNGKTGTVVLVASDVGAATAAQGVLAGTAVQPDDLADVATTGSYADLSGKPALGTAAAQNVGAFATAEQGELADTSVQPGGLSTALADYVEKETGYGLSEENFTLEEKQKLAGLEGSHFRGTFVSLSALEDEHPTASPGDYADVDGGEDSDVSRYIWDDSDEKWVVQAGSSSSVTASEVKTLYESNADTNAYTNAEKTKLGGVATGATKNSSTDELTEGSSNLYHTAARVRDAVLTGISTAITTAVAATDSVLVAIGKLAGRLETAFNRANHTGEQAISTVTGLQTALDAKAAIKGLPSRTVTASGAITPSDAGKWIVCNNSSAITLTIGAEATASWAVDGVLPVVHILQIGAGSVTIAGDGFTVNKHSSDTYVLAGAGAAATAVRTGSNAWQLLGRMGASA